MADLGQNEGKLMQFVWKSGKDRSKCQVCGICRKECTGLQDGGCI